MTSRNSPPVRMTSGNDNSQRSGRSTALQTPSNNEVTNNAGMPSHSIPRTIFAATITATVLMSHRCKKTFSVADIVSGPLQSRPSPGADAQKTDRRFKIQPHALDLGRLQTKLAGPQIASFFPMMHREPSRQHAKYFQSPAAKIAMFTPCEPQVFYREEGIVYQRARMGISVRVPLDLPRCQRRFEILEVDALQRLFHVQLARFAVQSRPVPVENAVGRVRVLLDLKHHNAGADGMNAAARKEHHIPRLHRHA